LSSIQKRNILLIDLPTFPKGVISLSLLSVAGCLSQKYNIIIEDLNLKEFDAYTPQIQNVVFVGLKVSSQSIEYAISISKQIKSVSPKTPIIWGGELASLMPDYCLQFADTLVIGLFEPIADILISDLESNKLQTKYRGANEEAKLVAPNFDFLLEKQKYYSFMGYPMETSRGCTEKCIFCMVHTMQKKNYNLAAISFLRDALPQYKGKFINVVDYNFGVNATHVIEVSKLIEKSEARGWMAEMCIDLLDNDTVLNHLQRSGCRIIYCGLESIDQQSLNSIHKMNTNHIENYERIIRKAQSYGIQIAAGIILGLEGTHKNTFKELFAFYHRMGISYSKLTFLTYNPGTKVHEYVRKKGTYINESIKSYDGNQLTFLPNGVDTAHISDGAEWFIKKYYSVWGIISRSFNSQLSYRRRIEFILFNLCYRDTYLQWTKYNTLQQPANIEGLINKPFKKSFVVTISEKILDRVRN
jgi:radical SAM superfamily enzyme YgiQ (UPF0313 family)